MSKCIKPMDAVKNFINISTTRVKNDPMKIILLSIFAGMFIAFGAAGSSVAAHNIEVPGLSRLVTGLVFPVGLMMVILTGAELFTGNCMFVMGVLEKKITAKKMMEVLLLAYFGNLIGGVLIAILISQSGQFDYTSGLLGAYTIKVASGKVALTFTKALISGILCNVLVCTAVFIAGSATDIIGKLFSVFFPILIFVVSGFEHSVANMYYIPAGILATKNRELVMTAMEQYGLSAEQIANVNWQRFFINNLLPVTIGNVLGGVFIFALPILYIYREKKGERQSEPYQFSWVRSNDCGN